MDSISQQELENFKQQRWFALHHYDNCSICGKEFTSLFFTRLDHFHDSFEQAWRAKNYISCWHQSDYESEAMWQLYTKDCTQGIAIKTTFERLYQALPPTEQPDFGWLIILILISITMEKSDMNFHPVEAPWYKREAFSHGKEFRTIIEDIRKNGFQDLLKI